jgi:hypothetical protein
LLFNSRLFGWAFNDHPNKTGQKFNITTNYPHIIYRLIFPIENVGAKVWVGEKIDAAAAGCRRLRRRLRRHLRRRFRRRPPPLAPSITPASPLMLPFAPPFEPSSPLMSPLFFLKVIITINAHVTVHVKVTAGSKVIPPM